MKTTILFFFLLSSTCFAQTRQDSLEKRITALEMSDRARIVELDSVWSKLYQIGLEFYEVRKEFRTEDYHSANDVIAIQEKLKVLLAFCEKQAKADPKNGKGWKILGQVIGEILKRTVPGL